MRISRGLLAFIAGMSLNASIYATSALAATLMPEGGEVLLNRGEGYKPVAGPTAVMVGDQVLAKPRGKGRIVYPDGCAINVEPSTVVTIADRSPCAPRGSHVETGGSLKDEPVPEQKDDRRYLLKGALIVGAAVGVILLVTDKDKPASP